MAWTPTADSRPMLPPTGGTERSRPPTDGRRASPGARVGEVALELDNPLSYVNANLAFVAEEVATLARRLEAAGAGGAELAEAARLILDAAADARDGVEKLRGLVRELQSLSAPAQTGPRRP
jgi:hypothetical protein